MCVFLAMKDAQASILVNRRSTALIFRVFSHVVLATLALVLPGVGPNRFWAAGLLVGIGSPIAVLINLRVKELSRNWAEALLDLIMIILLIHVLPHLWVVLMCLGLMVALAPSVSLHPSSHWIYLGFGVLLLTGMTFAMLVHDVEGWGLPLLAVAVTYPSMLFYTHSQMQHASELRRRANLLKGMTQLAGSVAHDFNNMLATVIGHAELAGFKLAGDHPAKQDIEQVVLGADQAALLCRQLLSFSGREVQPKGRVDLAAEVRAMASLLKPTMPAGVDIDITIEDDVCITAEVLQVHQVLMNVILNAGEAMIGHTGQVSIELRRAPANDHNSALLTVRDSGPGIPRSVSSQIFEPFISTKDDGYGLGLASTKKIMSDLDGSIAIHSDNSGTKVLLIWKEAPAGQPNTPEELSAPTVSDERHPLQLILVVDDDEDVRSVTINMLKHLGFDTLAASDAFQAQNILKDNFTSISAVILDLKMPIKDGWECLGDLREISQETPVVLCNGFDPKNNVQATVHEDANLHFLQKPYHADELTNVLNAMS